MADLLIVVVAVFVYFYVPGSTIKGVANLHTADWVQVRQVSMTQVRNDSHPNAPLVETIMSDAEFMISAEQVDMLKEFILSSTFTRTFRNGALMTSFPPSGVLNRYSIYAGFSDGVNPSRVLSVNISGDGYFMLDQFRNYIKIRNTDWEHAILQILERS